MKSFSPLDHPADVGVEARGTTREEAWEAAAEGVTELICSRIMITEAERREIAITAHDVPALLVQFLNHLLYLFDAEHFIARSFAVRFDGPLTLRCDCYGERIDPESYTMNGYVKAVTYHELEISHDAHGWTIRFMVDV